MVKKQWQVNYRNVKYVVELEKNEFWRWHLKCLSAPKSFPRFSSRSRKLTHWGAIKEQNNNIDQTLKDMKKAGF